MSKEVMQQAAEALENYVGVVEAVNEPDSFDTKVRDAGKPARDAIKALKEAIKQAGEPVAWMLRRELWERYNGYGRFADSKYDGLWDVPVYTAAPSIPAGWIETSERLPSSETPVLILFNGVIRIGELRWDIPGFEDTYPAYQYWDDPVNDGQEWEHEDITHWMPLPAAPSE